MVYKMFFIRMIFRNILKHKTKSIINILICILIILLLNVYIEHIVTSKSQLNRLSKTIPIECIITNLNHSQENGLEISEDIINKLEHSTYVKDELFTVQLIAGIGDFNMKDWKKYLDYGMVGTNSINAIPGTKDCIIELQTGESIDFLRGKDRKCIIGKNLMEQENLQIGDKVSLNTFYYTHENNYEVKVKKLELKEYEIVGVIDQLNWNINEVGILQPNIIVPFDTIRNIFYEADIPFYADSGSFQVANPEYLNEFKAEMQTIGFLNQQPNATYSYIGNTLLVRDANYISIASRLQQDIDISNGFFWIIIIIVILLGYIVSMLLTNSRQTETVLMRVMGMSFKQCFWLMLIEQVVLLILGGMIVGIVILLSFHYHTRALAFAEILFIASYLLGSMVALYRINKISLMEALSQLA